MGWFLTNVNPSHNLEIIEPSKGLSDPSVPYLALINNGIIEAGREKQTPIKNTAGNPTNLYATENNKGVRMELIWYVAVLEVTACSRWEVGTTLAVIAERAGPPIVLVTPSIATIAYMCQGFKESLINRIAARVMKKKLKHWVIDISFLRSNWSANAPPNNVAGIWTASCTNPSNPSCIPEPVSS